MKRNGNRENRVEAFFEICEKLGAEFFCFHDVDVAPSGETLEEFFQNLDVITDLIKEKMDQTGIKLLWNTANMFSHPRFKQRCSFNEQCRSLCLCSCPSQKKG